MKAAYITQHGGPEVIQYGDVPEPQPGPWDVKVRVRASALNRLDIYTRSGARGMKVQFNGPHILGGDCAGDVVAVGDLVSSVKAGDRVVVDPVLGPKDAPWQPGGEPGSVPSDMLGSRRSGSYAEYVVVPAGNVERIADSVSYESAAAVPTTFLPMWNLLIRRAKLQPWETALVHSASAGVGVAAIEVVKNVIGARVIATTSTPEKAARARELGADEVVLYTQEDVAKRVLALTGGRGVDVVVDHVGEQFFEASLIALRPGGRFGTCGVSSGFKANLHLGILFTKQLSVYGVFMGTREDFTQIVAMLNRGKIRPVVDRVFPLLEARQAHELMESRNFVGKILVRP